MKMPTQIGTLSLGTLTEGGSAKIYKPCCSEKVWASYEMYKIVQKMHLVQTLNRQIIGFWRVRYKFEPLLRRF